MRKNIIPKILSLTLLLTLAPSCGFIAPFKGLVQADHGNFRSFEITSKVAVPNLKKIGLNLGFATSWGAEQLNANVIKNPGFEGLIDSAIIIVKNSAPGRFSDNEDYLGRPDGFWTNAVYSVRSGRFAGQTGKIIDSRKTNAGNLPDFTIDNPALVLDAGDAVALTRIDDDGAPARWWITKDTENLVGVDVENRRPNSGGRRSLALNSQAEKAVSISSYLDAITARAGKMLPVNGAWRLSFWTMRKSGQANLSVSFGRQNSAAFAQKTISPPNVWQQIVINFNAKDEGADGILELNFKTSAASGTILIDDVELGAVQSENSSFRAEVINALKEIQPGYLRDWQGQLGDTIENRLADRFALRAVRVRPENLEAADFYYSIPEFLALCDEVRANPWLTVPTTANDAELIKLGAFLAANKYPFGEIVLEFGNENWNSIFRVAGISDAKAHGEAAARAFAKIREGAGEKIPLKFIVNGQHANPEAALDFLNETKNADALAVAPYFLPKLEAGKTTAENLDALFTGDAGKMRKLAAETRALNKELAVYEVNLHTMGGTAKSSDRDEITAGAAAGTALVKVLLDNLSLGVKRQCVYTFSGFDAKGDDRKNLVKLWGIVRDLGETRRFRPQGLALILLNRAVGGDLMEVSGEANAETDVSIYAFKNKEIRSAAIVSAAPASRRISLRFPANILRNPTKFKLLLLDAKNPTDTNEDKEQVKIVEAHFDVRDNVLSFEMPPYGFAVLLPEKENL